MCLNLLSDQRLTTVNALLRLITPYQSVGEHETNAEVANDFFLTFIC